MASSDPIGAGYALLYGVLSADATFMASITGIYQVMAPPAVTPNYCLLISQGNATDTNTGTGVRELSSVIYQVKLVGPQTAESALRSAYVRADGLLTPGGGPLRNTSGTLACERTGTFNQGELVNGLLWLNIGGLYRVEV